MDVGRKEAIDRGDFLKDKTKGHTYSSKNQGNSCRKVKKNDTKNPMDQSKKNIYSNILLYAAFTRPNIVGDINSVNILCYKA